MIVGRVIKVQGCQNLAIPASQRFQQSGKSVKGSDGQWKPKQEACIDLVCRSLPFVMKPYDDAAYSFPAGTWGSICKQMTCP